MTEDLSPISYLHVWLGNWHHWSLVPAPHPVSLWHQHQLSGIPLLEWRRWKEASQQERRSKGEELLLLCHTSHPPCTSGNNPKYGLWESCLPKSPIERKHSCCPRYTGRSLWIGDSSESLRVPSPMPFLKAWVSSCSPHSLNNKCSLFPKQACDTYLVKGILSWLIVLLPLLD